MRDPEASEPLTVAPGGELDRLLEEAAKDRSPWALPSLKFLAYTGAHITVLSGGYSQSLEWEDGASYMDHTWRPPIRSDAIRENFIYWRRTKNGKQIPMPLSRHLKGWLGPWLDQPRPQSDERYRQVFTRIGNRQGIHLNPLRLRHTCAVLLYHVYKRDPKEIERLLGVTSAVMGTYVAKPKWQVARELMDLGW